jgi:hypothetical protein
MSWRRACGWAVATLLAVAVSGARGGVINYLDVSGSDVAIYQRGDLNGFGQTFAADATSLVDASLLLASGGSYPLPWVDGFRFEVRAGPPRNFDGTGGNILFQSPPLHIADVPVSGSRLGLELRELKLTASGYSSPLPLTIGDTYSLVLRDLGTSGSLQYAIHQPQVYTGGGEVLHNRAYANNFWAGPDNIEDMAFKVVMIPEPSGLGTLVIAGVIASRRPRRTSSK